MKIIKNINNNFALAEDGNGSTLVIRGKGIGYGNIPRDVDIRTIERSYYEVSEQYLKTIGNIPENMIDIATLIVDKARQELSTPINSSVVFTLADHLTFAIQRTSNNINVFLPIVHDVNYFYENEIAVARYGLEIIKEKLGILLSKEEAAFIALHLINAEEQMLTNDGMRNKDCIDNIVNTIENEYQTKINRDDFNYSRFVSHMNYLLKRGKTNHLVYSNNSMIYEQIKREYPKTYICTEFIKDYLVKNNNLILTEEEMLYLMLHINRLCTREDMK